MKRFLIILGMMLLVFSVGCSKNNKPAKSTTTQAEKRPNFAHKSLPLDLVSKKIINKDKDKIKYTFTYNNVKFYFESEENMKKFKSNPSKYIGK